MSRQRLHRARRRAAQLAEAAEGRVAAHAARRTGAAPAGRTRRRCSRPAPGRPAGVSTSDVVHGSGRNCIACGANPWFSGPLPAPVRTRAPACSALRTKSRDCAHRLREVGAEREVAGDRAGQRAAGAVRVAAGDARCAQPHGRRAACEQQVADACRRPGARPSAARRGAPIVQQLARGLFHVGFAGERLADQQGASSRLGVTRWPAGTARAPARRPLRRRSARAAGGDHHRVEHHVRSWWRRSAAGHCRARSSARMQHADLHRIDADVLDHRIDLVGEDVRRHGVDATARRACSAP